MSEAKFTKGPWMLMDGDSLESEKVVTTHDRNARSVGRICEIDIYFAGWHGVEQEANAHLIAAAPDLYDAIKDVVDSYQKNNGLSIDIEAIIKARDAMSKAKGE